MGLLTVSLFRKTRWWMSEKILIQSAPNPHRNVGVFILKEYLFYMNLKKIIKEEMDDLDWIRNIDPNYMEFPEGTQIKITNIGSEEAFLEWLGDFQEDYMNNFYGFRGAIIGTVGESDYYDDGVVKGFYLWETNTGDHIYFPYHRYMNDLNKNEHGHGSLDYSGLNLEYKIIR